MKRTSSLSRGIDASVMSHTALFVKVQFCRKIMHTSLCTILWMALFSWVPRIFNDKAFFFPMAENQFGQLFNFCIFIKLFIHKVKKTSKVRFWGYICLTNINSRYFYVYYGILLYEYIEISFFSYTMLFPPVIHNFLLKHYLLPQYTLYKEVVYHRGEQYRISKNWTLYIFLQRNALIDVNISIIDICFTNMAPISKTLMFYLLHEWKIQ